MTKVACDGSEAARQPRPLRSLPPPLLVAATVAVLSNRPLPRKYLHRLHLMRRISPLWVLPMAPLLLLCQPPPPKVRSHLLHCAQPGRLGMPMRRR